MNAALDLDIDDASPEWSYRGEGVKAGRRASLACLFDWPAHRHPDAPALADGATAWTFAQLERCALGAARRLRAAGVAPGAHVLVLSEKRAVMAAVAAGIWKVGGVYVPVDAQSPAARLAGIAAQARPVAVVGSRTALAACAQALACPADAYVAFEDVADCAAAPACDNGAVAPAVDESQAAYVIFTSGSTGAPKGVAISHRSLLDYFYNHNQVLRFTPQSRVFSLAPFHFDVSIEDTLLPLSVGAFVFQFRGLALGPVLRKALGEQRITHLIAVSTLLGLITEDGREVSGQAFPDLRMVMTGAEVCDPKLIDLWVKRFPLARVINAYGPTEATIVCLTHTITRGSAPAGSTYPIGRPLPGVEALLVDEADRPIEGVEVPGELLIGGSQVMIGYLCRPQETERVCPVIDGRRWYRTGDRCRRDAEARFVYLERMDDMVKIGGQRVHLGEIRQCALGLEGVVRAAVGGMQADGLPAIAMVAVLQSGVADDDARAHEAAARRIRAALAELLPVYMLPRVLAVTTQGALTSSGKTDERALLARVCEAMPNGKGDFHVAADSEVRPLGGSVR